MPVAKCRGCGKWVKWKTRKGDTMNTVRCPCGGRLRGLSMSIMGDYREYINAHYEERVVMAVKADPKEGG